MTVYAYKYGCPPLDWREDAADRLYRQKQARNHWSRSSARTATSGAHRWPKTRPSPIWRRRLPTRRQNRRGQGGSQGGAYREAPSQRRPGRRRCVVRSGRRTHRRWRAREGGTTSRQGRHEAEFDALADERYQAVTAARQEAAAGGLWWGTTTPCWLAMKRPASGR